MRSVRNLRDAEIILGQHDDFISTLKNKELDLNNRKIINVGDAINPTDAVNLAQVKSLVGSGFSGSFNYIKTVDFAGSKVTLGTIIVTDGKITGVK